MYTLRRWWDRNWLQVMLAGLVVSTAWIVRQTQGEAIFEVYQLVSRPFQSGSTKQERLLDASTLELQARIEELESQNQKLRELVGYTPKDQGQGVKAPIIGRSADHWWQQLTLGRGSQAGIKNGSIVTAPGGLIGRVTSVTSHTSRVLLISDSSSRVGVTISRSRYMGVMRGQSGNKAIMQFFERVPDVRQGDVVATAPVSQLFPPGLPIGRIESVNLSKTPAPEAIIALSAPLSDLEWAIVYPAPKNPDSDLSEGKNPTPN